MTRSLFLWLFVLVGFGYGTGACGADYEVGPNKRFASIDQVPWEFLGPGDRVLIHWQPKAYLAKWVICRNGTVQAPIVIRGVPGPHGELPIVRGQSAITRPSLDFWGEERGVIKIGGASHPDDTLPSHIVVENLEIQGARPPHRFISRRGIRQYARNAAAIYVEKGEDITIRNCTLRDSGNGLFIGPETTRVLIERCRIFDNGTPGSFYEHNVYTEANGITFQFNYLGPLRSECLGNNLKDRSAGLVIRFNWIEGGNRQLDLVDAEGSDTIREAPAYRETFVYGNVVVERSNEGNNQIVHYGGDSGHTDWYRKGTLYFFHNTVVSKRTGSTTLFRLSTNEEHLDCRNNIFFTTAPGRSLAVLDETGQAVLTHNWFPRGWVKTHGHLAGRVHTDRSLLIGETPGFRALEKDDYRLQADSPCRDSGVTLPQSAQPHRPRYQLRGRYGFQPRPLDARIDVGAFEFSPTATD